MRGELYEKIANCKTVSDFSALKEKIKTTFQREEYGFFPPEPLSVKGNVLSSEETIKPSCC